MVLGWNPEFQAAHKAANANDVAMRRSDTAAASGTGSGAKKVRHLKITRKWHSSKLKGVGAAKPS
jgi:hypothetical protein